MKKLLVIILSVISMTAFVSCDDTQVYGDELKKEKKLIAEYIKRNNINIIDTLPLNGNWGENDYIEIQDYLYFHLVSMGDTTTDGLSYRDNISLRYRKYTLNEYADTISMWNTNDSPSPIEFQYGISSNNTCNAWLYALPYMQYTNSEAKIICPSKLGFSDDTYTVTPYGYDLKIKIRK